MKTRTLRALVSLLCTLAIASAPARAQLAPAAQALVSYLQNAELTGSGFTGCVLADDTKGNTISPYEGNYAAIGLATIANSTTIPIALCWLEWHVSAVNASNYTSTPNNPCPSLGCCMYGWTFSGSGSSATISLDTGNVMSFNAEPGTFLTAMRWLYATGNYSAQMWIQGQEYNAECAANAIVGTISGLGCTWGKPANKSCELENNFEAWRGLNDICYLEQNVYGWNSSACAPGSNYEMVLNEIGSWFSDIMYDGNPASADCPNLWPTGVPCPNYSHSQSLPGGSINYSSWKTFDPDSVCWLWAVIAGYTPPTNNLQTMWAVFKTAWPAAPFSSQDTITSAPWPRVAQDAALFNDVGTLGFYIRCLNGNAALGGYQYPWTDSDSGNLLDAFVESGWQNIQSGLYVVVPTLPPTVTTC
jgi:hypothetical protein